MRDPMSWSLPIGRMFGIQIRVHILLLIVFVGLVGRAAAEKDVVPGTWIDVAMLEGLLFFSILLHEFGHCFGARYADGDANEVLLWPLGGLAYCDVPHTPRANFICVICGPLVNVILCLICGVLIVALEPTVRPPWNPFWHFWRVPPEKSGGIEGAVELVTWAGNSFYTNAPALLILTRFFWVNWVLFLFNMVVVAFPMDAGRILQCILWKYVGYQRATMTAVMVGFVFAIIIGIISFVTNEWLLGGLALFIYISCRQQWIILEMGDEASPFGYDFSQGYTSLEREQPTTAPRRKQGWFARWRQRRAQQRMLREQETREAEERRLDELLEKVKQVGLARLTDEERRFLKRASDRYRNRQ